jgi:hypothetical protein
MVWSGAAAAETVYRWVDENGVVNFSSEPRPGAETMDLGPLPTTRLDTPAPAREESEQAPAADAPDYRLGIENLHDGQVVWNDARRLELVFDLSPQLAAGRGHRLEVYLDDTRRAVLRDGRRVVLEDVDRGTHRVRAEIVDAEGRRLARSAELTIHHRQHSLPTAEPAATATPSPIPSTMPVPRRIEPERRPLSGDAGRAHGMAP